MILFHEFYCNDIRCAIESIKTPALQMWKLIEKNIEIVSRSVWNYTNFYFTCSQICIACYTVTIGFHQTFSQSLYENFPSFDGSFLDFSDYDYILSEDYCKNHFLAGHLLRSFNAAIYEPPEIRSIAIETLRNLIAKHAFDDRLSRLLHNYMDGCSFSKKCPGNLLFTPRECSPSVHTMKTMN